MVERLNAATNLLGFALVIAGAALAMKRPDIGASVITGGFGLLAGHGIASSSKSST